MTTPDEVIERIDVGLQAAGDVAQWAGPRTKCWRCNAVPAVSDVGLCAHCLDRLRDEDAGPAAVPADAVARLMAQTARIAEQASRAGDELRRAFDGVRQVVTSSVFLFDTRGHWHLVRIDPASPASEVRVPVGPAIEPEPHPPAGDVVEMVTFERDARRPKFYRAQSACRWVREDGQSRLELDPAP